MDPNTFSNIDNSRFVGNGYYNSQPPTAQNINVNAIPNYNNDSVLYNNNAFPSQHVNTNMFSDKTNSQFHPMSYTPQNVSHVDRISPHHMGYTSGNTFGSTSLPVVSQTEFEIPGFKIKIIVEPISYQQVQQPLIGNNISKNPF
ncbi:hypothetical protein RclHR1_00080020 [Rhizophagus clarus]|uniref:Uncharacterized protein n=1 Tax=Rhizophagus clarus TaxID=94130 RepID=A0A2Z6S5W9_9GLOM|nr:hypothetical protein RclHR1_00080020 [Rhizophagus clarus]GET04057.1 hypothetical protein GLOIN_2v1475074 [Rhizophagus clarus]